MRKFFRRLLLGLLYTLLALFLLSILQVVALRWLPVWRTPLMCIRQKEYKTDKTFQTRYEWIDISAISPHMVRAVIASEDNLFESHNGFDWKQVQKAWGKENRRQKRGASTITQQVAKNVFLWPGRSWLRKGLEAYYTVLIECFWSKKRIMEVYLNVAEMGKGIYGIASAAQVYYGKPAAKVTAPEAALIAACLPNPLKRDPRRPTAYLQQRRETIMDLMRKLPFPAFL